MLRIKTFIMNAISENCYVVSDESGEAVIIDGGAGSARDCEALQKYIAKEQLKPCRYLCTHAHFDHVMGSPFIWAHYALSPEIHADDKLIYDSVPQMMQAFIGQRFEGTLPLVRNFLNDGDVIPFGSHQLEVIATPGHTPGGVCFYCASEQVLFSGDTLFCMSIGRSDLPGGNYRQLIESITGRLFSLPDEVTVYPGHGETTTIARERDCNPYLR